MPDLIKILINIRVFLITLILGLATYYMIAIAHKNLGNNLPFLLTKKKLIKLIIAVVSLGIIYKIISRGGMIITIIILLITSAIIAYLMNPIVNKLERKNIKRPIAILIVYIGIFGLFLSMIFTIGPRIVQEITEFGQKLPSYALEFYKIIMKFYKNNLEEINKMSKALNIESPDKIITSSLNAIKKYSTEWIMSFATGLTGFFGKIFNLVLIPIITFYMLKDKEKFKNFAIKAIPWKKRKEYISVLKEIDDIIGKFIRGQLIVCTFIGVATSIALMIIGVEFSILIGIFAGIFNIVPYLGPIIGFVPAAIMALLDDPIKVIWVAIAIIIIQQTESNFITPKIVGDSVGVHPIIIMVGVILGGAYFGLLGMLFAVPVIVISRILYRYFRYKIKNMKDKELF